MFWGSRLNAKDATDLSLLMNQKSNRSKEGEESNEPVMIGSFKYHLSSAFLKGIDG
jgi:hypothetical protein